VSEEIILRLQADLEQAEQQLKTALDLIEKLRRAGEDTTQLQAQARKLQQRIQRYRRAFSA